jgi:hypothetical protein
VSFVDGLAFAQFGMFVFCFGTLFFFLGFRGSMAFWGETKERKRWVLSGVSRVSVSVSLSLSRPLRFTVRKTETETDTQKRGYGLWDT